MNLSKSKKASVIGAGVSGLSCALLLDQNGWDVTIFSKDDPNRVNQDPEFVSSVPAASVIPHSVNSKITEELFNRSNEYFIKLYEQNFPGITIDEHFELFAYPKDIPEYAFQMRSFAPYPSFENDFHPRHPDIEIVTGWKFNCFFTDWSLYFPALLSEIKRAGIDIKVQKLKREDLTELPGEVIINCSELGSIDLFDDPNTLIHRGHILKIPGAPALVDPEGKCVSYNFTPGKDVYQTESGLTQDVYCYSRSDGWVWGGSRQKGTLSSSGSWEIEHNKGDTELISGHDVPKEIFRLNKDIIEYTFGLDTADFKPVTSKMGYRYVRKKQNGVRLETEEIADKLVVHNYGHGGAGVTLSWGCAGKVVEMVGGLEV